MDSFLFIHHKIKMMGILSHVRKCKSNNQWVPMTHLNNKMKKIIDLE